MSEAVDAVESFQLAPVLDLKAAAPLKAALMERRGHPLEIDAADVQRMGGLCLQVLLAAAAAWRTDGVSMRIGPRSEAFLDALRIFGGESAFQYQPEGVSL
ncbi:STAS domain-containing protein [Phenylobacterium montanum]|uniref:STAS domain-containing protein n=1 Tax=Phenylobacterium montanum TaxID=2823693 RepID=A0A975FZX2_9CAUL|nr:STAS domain-containing protein [Caulobacter sp. S6]QUD87997.1 STAS domain-containing protein [Caulobacter sp. S6]